MVALVVGVLSILSGAGAVTLPLLGHNTGLNDLGALSQGFGQTPTRVPTVRRAEPPLVATPRAHCGPGSRPEPSIQGRVPAGSATNGLWCNTALVAHQGTSGGFKVYRYADQQGHVCAFYDTALLFPTNALNLAGPSLGVAVLDMSNPAHPVQTDTLTQLPMLTPHESLNLNARRGLLAAVSGNPATAPGLFVLYDVHADCRHPQLDYSGLLARFGHESGFSPDGRTFWATGTSVRSITAIDVTDPKSPHAIWQGNVVSHGMTIGDDGNRAYVADPLGGDSPNPNGGDMLIMDVSQIQARKPNPQAREISRLTWASASIPQNAIPFTENGHPYVLEFDEYTQGTLNSFANHDAVGAGRIIDIADETKPRVVANLRLQIDQAADHHAYAATDPGNQDPAQGYAAHYCNIPTRVDPKIVACSFISSGLRLFNISDILHPREIGYFVSPTTPNTENGYNGSDFTMSQPTFDVARHDIWYTDGGTGFYVLHVTNRVWPTASSPYPQLHPRPGCPLATGRLSGRRLGPVTLGMTRAAARRAFTHSSRRNRRYMDFFCLTPNGIRVAYPSPALLRTLPRATRRRVTGRVVLALTANRHYALTGVRPGAPLRAVARRLHVGRGRRIGLNTWYLFAAGASRGVFKVRHGVIEEVGIADRRLTASRATARRLMRTLT